MNEMVNSLGLDQGSLWIAVLVLAVLLLVFGILLIVQNVKLRRLSERCDRFMRGADGRNLEEAVYEMFEENARIRDDLDRCGSQIGNIYYRLRSTIQKVGVVKYDAFAQLGGMLSYAVALLDENNSGIMINSVHSADGCYSYTKVIHNGKSDVELGAEEEQALANALASFHKREER
ncbi:DUF4446 family protein [Lachnoclostridium sp. Marseille-P6806]|uniref:DUF4446 family protein n=1 Tax=Lachnoclostridium sp. Marseille-P6806 TaxID=2364793 RepID=UPI00102F4BBF|nr:DUF4446 family protein [Lachnoclostridium sp. Marseille-P6806]